MSFTLDLLVFAAGGLHVLLAPYSKVEESFNLHATHDILMYGYGHESLQQYDHFKFPGPVPRTFLGSLLLSWISYPVVQIAGQTGLVARKSDIQIVIRIVLASINAFGLGCIRRAVSRRFGRLTGLFFALLTISQFHIPFWMGRTLPNMFALLPVNLATALLLDLAPNAVNTSPKQLYTALSLLTVAGVIFRAEISLPLIPLSLISLFRSACTFTGVLKVGVVTAGLSIALSVIVDTYFWQSSFPLWPELAGLYFNVFQGKSSEWGTSPIWTYFLSSLPKLLLSSLPLSALAFLVDPRTRPILIPNVLFIGLISLLAHKEWRFIVYVVPSFNVAAARGARWMVSRRKSSITGQLSFLIVIGFIILNIGVTTITTLASIHNYPGGEAMRVLNQHIAESGLDQAHVHISNLAAQTGASLFLQEHAPPHKFMLGESVVPTTYNKTEGLCIKYLASSSLFTHLISEGSIQEMPWLDQGKWKEVAVIEGFDGWDFHLGSLKEKWRAGQGIWDLVEQMTSVARMKKRKMLWLLERR